MKREAKIRLIAVAVTVLIAVILLVWMIGSLRNAIMGGIQSLGAIDEETWVAPTVDPQTLYDQTAYEATLPTDPPVDQTPAPTEELVTVPVDMTAEELAREEAASQPG